MASSCCASASCSFVNSFSGQANSRCKAVQPFDSPRLCTMQAGLAEHRRKGLQLKPVRPRVLRRCSYKHSRLGLSLQWCSRHLSAHQLRSDKTSCNLPLALLVMQLSELAQVLHTRSKTETMFNHSVQAVEPGFNSFGAIVGGEPA